MKPLNRKDPKQSTCNFIGSKTKHVKDSSWSTGGLERQILPIITPSTTLPPITASCDPTFSIPQNFWLTM
jgi:hypothetical protein